MIIHLGEYLFFIFLERTVDMIITGKTALAAIFANPATHSISPLMHNRAFELANIDARYLAFEIEATEATLTRAIQSIRDLHLLGVNLSMPFKQLALPYLDHVSPEVELIQAVNTIVNDHGVLTGYNTDGKGFIRALNQNVTIEDSTMTVLGCGGAALAIVAQCALDGAKKIHVVNRNSDSFQAFKQHAARIEAVTKCTINLIDLKEEHLVQDALDQSQLLVNTSALGMHPYEGKMVLANTMTLKSTLHVVDIIYRPDETALLTFAKQQGCTTQNGLGMLIHQGALAFELWTKTPMPIDEITNWLTTEIISH